MCLEKSHLLISNWMKLFNDNTTSKTVFIRNVSNEITAGWLTDLENENLAYLINLIIYFSSRKVKKGTNYSSPLHKNCLVIV